MRWADEIKTCDYCHTSVSIYESLTEYGKHYHESCYIHRTQKEIESYKKKFLNKNLTQGDKIDLVDKFNLVQKLMIERTEFRGFTPICEFRKDTPLRTEKSVLYLGNGLVAVDKTGFPVIIETKSSTVSFRTLKLRPVVDRIKSDIKPKMLTVKDIPLLMEILPAGD